MEILNRHPPFGNQVKEAVASLPKYEVDIEQKSNYGVSKAELVISVTMVNYIKRQDSGKSTGFHYCILLVADADNQIVHKQRLSDAVFFAIGTWSKKIEVKRAYSSSELTINVISQDLVGLDLQKTFTPYYNGPHIDYYKRPT
ncbi:probable ATP-dependent DNA helicase HFM1 isoform X1, partial [Paramuricea clavata]